MIFQKSLYTLKSVHNGLIGRTMPAEEKQNQELLQSFKEENTLLNLANVSAKELEHEVNCLQGKLEQVMLQKFLKQKPQEAKKPTKDLLRLFYEEFGKLEGSA